MGTSALSYEPKPMLKSMSGMFEKFKGNLVIVKIVKSLNQPMKSVEHLQILLFLKRLLLLFIQNLLFQLLYFSPDL